MWWPRPRWKSDFLARFVLLVFITVTTTSNVVMADEGQHCGGSDMSAVIWTTALCTMLLVLIVVVIYFVYCKKREHDWSSLWWKSNSDKNIVLQTSPPTNGQPQKIGGTDNPAFLADSYVVGRVTKTGLTKIVHAPSLNDGSLGAELSTKEEDGRKIFMCKHNDGSKDRLVAVRLVFDKEKQPRGGQASDLSRALVELSRDYGLQVELETEGDAVTASVVTGEPEKRAARPDIMSAVRGTARRLWQQRPLAFKGGDADDKTKDDDNDVESGPAPAESEQRKPAACSVTTVDETSRATAVPSPQQQQQQQQQQKQQQQQQQQQPPAPSSNCNGGVPIQSTRYRTLEYGASPADATDLDSPDSGVQCCVVNSSGPVPAAVVRADDETKVDEKDGNDGNDGNDAKVRNDGEQTGRAAEAKDDDGPKHANPPPPPPPRKYSASVQVSAAAATAVPAATPAATETTTEPAAVVTAAPVHVDALPMVSVAPVKTAPPPLTAGSEIRIDDDYYWCTTTAMAAPSMSTFGKRPSVTAAVTAGSDDETPPQARAVVPDGSGSAVSTVRSDVDAVPAFAEKSPVFAEKSPVLAEKSPVFAEKSPVLVEKSPVFAEKSPVFAEKSPVLVEKSPVFAEKSPVFAEKSPVFAEKSPVFGRVDDHDHNDNDRDKRAVVDDGTEEAASDDADALDGDGDRDIALVAGGGTTSIEDASLPSFSSDEDEDDDGAFAGKTQYPCDDGPAVRTDGKDAVVTRPSCGDRYESGAATAKAGDDGRKGRKPDAKAYCDGESRVNVNGVAPTADAKSPTKLPTLRLSLSSPLQSSAAAATSCCSSSASSTSSTSSSPTNNNNNNNNNNNSPIVSKIPVRRQSAGNSSSVISNGGSAVSVSMTNNGSAKKSIPLPLSRSGSRLAMWSSVN